MLSPVVALPSLPRVVVIGAGISGLSCAYSLRHYGFPITVYEANDYVGGRMSTRTHADLPFDIGTNHLCNLYTHMRAACDVLSVPWLPMKDRPYHVFDGSRAVPLLSSIPWSARLKLLRSDRCKRKIQNPLDLSDAVCLDTDNAYDLAKRRFAPDVANLLVDGFTSTYQFHRAADLSAGVMYAILESIKDDGAAWDLQRLEGGMIALPQALATMMDVRLSLPLASIVSQTSHIDLVFQDGSQTQADIVVLATTAPVAAKIYKNPTDNERALLCSSRYASTISLAFRVPLDALPPANVTWVPFKHSSLVSGYTNETMKGSSLISHGTSLLCAWLHDAAARELLYQTDAQICATVLPELRRVCPSLPASIELYDLERWKHAMPIFAPGSLTRVADFLKFHQGSQRVYLCGDYLNSLWAEGAFRCGERVAETINATYGTHRS